MPSKFTENYKLNLWDAADRVLHEDFNEDNRRIDAALDSKVAKIILHDFTLTEPKTNIKFQVMEEEWWKYSIIFLTITAGSTFCDSITFRTGDTSAADRCRALNSSNSEKACLSFCASSWASTTIFFPGGSPQNVIQALTIENSFLFFGSGATYQNGKTISLTSNDIPAGTRIRVTALL